MYALSGLLVGAVCNGNFLPNIDPEYTISLNNKTLFFYNLGKLFR